MLTRYIRSAILEVLREDFMRTARRRRADPATGCGLLYGPLNVAIPIVTVIGLQIAGLLVGAVVIESVFNLPGLGAGLLSRW